MPVYVYRAETPEKKVVLDQLEALNLDHAASILMANGLRIVNLREQSNGHIFEKKVQTTFGLITLHDIFVFTRYFAIFHRSGVSILRSLEILRKRTKNAKFREVIISIHADVTGGHSLYYAFFKHPGIFDNFYTAMIRVGEDSNRLAEVLDRLAVKLERRMEIRRKIIGVLAYPAMLSVAIFGIVTLFLVNLLPKFAAFFEGLQLKLPAITLFTLGVSKWTREHYPLIPTVILLLVAAINATLATTRGKLFWDRMILRIPLFGAMLLNRHIGDVFRNVSLLYKAGYTIVDAFKHSVSGVDNTWIAARLEGAIENIESGITISESLMRSGVVTDIAMDMVMVGEETNKFDTMIQSIADYFEKEVDYTIDVVIKRMEPILLVFFGFIVGGLLLSVYLPIFTSVDAVPL